jgi:hypothetical protein
MHNMQIIGMSFVVTRERDVVVCAEKGERGNDNEPFIIGRGETNQPLVRLFATINCVCV